MKLDEDLAYDRGIECQTDDEEDRAERVLNHIDDDSESDITPYSWNQSDGVNIETCSWPQSIRNSMDMLTSTTPPSSSFLKGSVLKPMSNLLSKVTKSKTTETVGDDSPLNKPLISETIIDKEEVAALNLSLSSASKLSENELPSTHDGQCSYAQSVLNGINILCGIGLLTTPYAVREGGWLGLSLLLMFGVMSCYTGILLKRCLESTPGLRSYPDIGEAAFGFAGRLTISTLLYMELYAACVEYITMIGDNLASVFPNTSMNYAGMKFDSHQVFAISATLLILPTVWLRNLSLLSYLSVGGVGASILVSLCLLWVGVVNQVGFHPSTKVLDLANLPVAIGIYGYGFSGHPVFPSIYSSMKEPHLFPHVLVISFVFCFFLYTGVAVCGYLMFGDSVKSQFTLNMPNQLVASKIAVWTTVVNPFTKYALTITPVTWGLEELLPMALRDYYSISIVLRTTVVVSTLVVALTIPFFGSVMALAGSMLAMLVAIFFPCACYISIFINKLNKFQIAVCIIIMITSMLCSCIGTYSAIIRIAGEMGLNK